MVAAEFNTLTARPQPGFRAEGPGRGAETQSCPADLRHLRQRHPLSCALTIDDAIFAEALDIPRTVCGCGPGSLNMLKLKDPTLLETRAYVNGQWIANGRSFAVNNPSTGQKIADVTDLGAAEVRAAIDLAHGARRAWAARTGKDRGAILRRWYDLLVENADDLASILTAEMGKPFAEARGEILYGASYVEWFAEEAKRIYGDVIPGHQPDKRIVVLKQPVGVVAAITPWNFPNAMIARKVAPALAVGCTFLARPAELTPLSALAMAVLADRAGIPAGVFNVIPGSDASAVGKELCTNGKVAKITFTGSTRVGGILMEQGASTIKKLSLELGGNAPFIVFDDADIDAAVEGALIAKFRNAGQTCVCANRIYRAIRRLSRIRRQTCRKDDAFHRRGRVPEVVIIGPLISEAAVAKVEEHLADALAKVQVSSPAAHATILAARFPAHAADRNDERHADRARRDLRPLAPLFQFDTEDDG